MATQVNAVPEPGRQAAGGAAHHLSPANPSADPPPPQRKTDRHAPTPRPDTAHRIAAHHHASLTDREQAQFERALTYVRKAVAKTGPMSTRLKARIRDTLAPVLSTLTQADNPDPQYVDQRLISNPAPTPTSNPEEAPTAT